MAGTDRTRAAAAGGGPAIILVEPQMGENIGTAARAMLNCGLDDLRLVRPRDGWPSEKAASAASGADAVVDAARLFETTAEAIADLDLVYAATARRRDMLKHVLTPAEAARRLRAADAQGRRIGVLFGPERRGLNNDDVTLADAVIEAPLNPAFASLNLAQAVLLVGYEWYQAGAGAPPAVLPTGGFRPATKRELIDMFEHLERELDAAGFLYPPEKRPSMVRNIRNMLDRAGLMDPEVRTFRGIISALSKGRRDGNTNS